MKVVFRVDSSARMGGGHVMRCLTLAEALRERGACVRFVSRALPGALTGLVGQRAFETALLPAADGGQAGQDAGYAAWLGVTQAEDAEQTVQALRGEQPEWLIVDHYALDAAWEGRVRPAVRRVMAIDDLANRRHDCDVLLDQNYTPGGAHRYTGLVPASCRLLLGTEYALLRRPFRELRGRLVPRERRLKRVLVFFTAGDDQGETLKALQGVGQFGKAERVDVVIGASNPDREAITRLCGEKGWSVHCDIDYMAELIACADLALGASGSTSWERCALGTPTLLAVLAENQEANARALACAGAAVNLGWSRDLQPEAYARALDGLAPERLRAMSEKALGLVDACGVERVAALLLEGGGAGGGETRRGV